VKSSSINLLFFLIILILAGVFRFTYLDLRPMHTDEAVHAIKFGMLLENGEYRYDKNEYHGPVLNYLTLIPAFLSGEKNLDETDEITLRLVPAIIGLFLVLIPLWLLNRNVWFSFSAALLLAISPAMVFYSRYYIMEILLVTFTYGFIASCFRYLQNHKILPVISAGFFLGLMHATKETWIISIAAMVFALSIMFYFNKKGVILADTLRSVRIKHVLIGLTIAILISITFYSSFFTNMQGIYDSIGTYSNYYERAGQNAIHSHPWDYYIKLLSWTTGPGDFIWSELLIVFLAAFGFIGLLRKKARKDEFYWLLLFIGIYSIILALVYSFLPYKTPWNLLQFYAGFIIMAGYGIYMIFEVEANLKGKIVIGIFIAGGIFHLAWQSWAGNIRYCADPHNPYVYGHTHANFKDVPEKIDKIASVHPDGKNMYIEVVFPGSDYWPLPWYLRNYPNTGWWDTVDMKVSAAPVVIASPEVEKDLVKKWYTIPPPGQKHLYMPLFDKYTALRPGIELRGYVRKDTWDKLQVEKQEN